MKKENVGLASHVDLDTNVYQVQPPRKVKTLGGMVRTSTTKLPLVYTNITASLIC